MKNILQKSLDVSNTYLPGVKGDVHNTSLMSGANGNTLSTNNTRIASDIILNYFSCSSVSEKDVSNSSRSVKTSGTSNSTAERVVGSGSGGVKALASKPVFSVSGNKVVVTTFYYLPHSGQSLSSNSVNSLGEVLSKLFGQPVELRLVRLHYPYLNSHILAQYIAINSSKYNFTRIQRAIFSAVKSVRVDGATNETLLPAYITGIKITISGRLATERSVPRQTEKTVQIGTFSNSSLRSGKGIIESASFTSKNKKGAFTVKVWISQVAYTQ